MRTLSSAVDESTKKLSRVEQSRRNNGSVHRVNAISVFTNFAVYLQVLSLRFLTFSLLCRPEVTVLPALWCLTVLPCACNRGSVDRLRGSARIKISSSGAVPAAAFLFLTGALSARPCPLLAMTSTGTVWLWVVVDSRFSSRCSPAWSRQTGGWAADARTLKTNKTSRCQSCRTVKHWTLSFVPFCTIESRSQILWHLTLVTLASLTRKPVTSSGCAWGGWEEPSAQRKASSVQTNRKDLLER
jgi:hypothetical protein